MSAVPRPLPTLREVVEKYRQLAGGFGRPLPLGEFGFSNEETERLFGFLDEDYHISRFLHFSLQPAGSASSARSFRINGFPQSHITLDAEIESIL